MRPWDGKEAVPASSYCEKQRRESFSESCAGFRKASLPVR
jgi:hypothetical protein